MLADRKHGRRKRHRKRWRALERAEPSVVVQLGMKRLILSNILKFTGCQAITCACADLSDASRISYCFNTVNSSVTNICCGVYNANLNEIHNDAGLSKWLSVYNLQRRRYAPHCPIYLPDSELSSLYANNFAHFYVASVRHS